MSARPRLLFTVNQAAFFLSDRLAIARAAAQAGFDVHVATPAEPEAEAIRAEGFAFHPVPISRRGVNPWQEARTLWSLVRLYRALRPHIVHLVTIKPVIYGGLAARLSGVPAVESAVTGLGYVFIEPGPRGAALRWLARTAYRLALGHPNGRAIFQNPDDRAEFLARGLVAERATVLIKGACVDGRIFTPRPEAAGAPLVVLPARMLWDKGVGEFVEAARSLRAAGVEARFALVGDTDPGNPAAIPRPRLTAWRDEGVVEWWGHRTDMPSVLAEAHVVCLPSYREGLPKSLIEAAACARPIVATDVPGCREAARPGVNALLVPARDPRALAEAIRRLVADPALRRELGARGRALAEAEFSLERVLGDTLALHDELLCAAGAARPPAPGAATDPATRCSPDRSW